MSLEVPGGEEAAVEEQQLGGQEPSKEDINQHLMSHAESQQEQQDVPNAEIPQASGLSNGSTTPLSCGAEQTYQVAPTFNQSAVNCPTTDGVYEAGTVATAAAVTAAPTTVPAAADGVSGVGYSLDAFGAESQPTRPECGVMTEEEKSKRKIFVGGLSRDSTSETLRDYFSQYGEIYDAEVLMDKVTFRSRGFGFVTFYDVEGLESVVDKPHTIDGAQVEVRRAIPREEARREDRSEIPSDGSGRLFVGGLGDEVTDDQLRDHFSQYGELLSANVLVDKQTNRPRGFGFVIFKNPEDSEKAIGPHADLGHHCEAKRAQPRSHAGRSSSRGGYGSRMDGRGRRDDYYGQGYNMDQSMYAGYGQGYGQGYNYAAYHPYYAAYYAQMAAAYGSYGYSQSPTDMSSSGADRGSRMQSNRSTPY